MMHDQKYIKLDDTCSK